MVLDALKSLVAARKWAVSKRRSDANGKAGAAALKAAPAANDDDEIGVAISRSTRSRDANPSRLDRMNAEQLLSKRRDGDDFETNIAALLEYVRLFPSSARMQILCARLIERTRQPHRAVRAWSGLLERFPDSGEAFRMCLRWKVREEGIEARAVQRSVLSPPCHGV